MRIITALENLFYLLKIKFQYFNYAAGKDCAETTSAVVGLLHSKAVAQVTDATITQSVMATPLFSKPSGRAGLQVFTFESRD